MKYFIILALFGATAALSGSAEVETNPNVALPQVPGISPSEFREALSQLPPELASLLGPLPPVSAGRQRIARRMLKSHLRLQRQAAPSLSLNIQALSQLNLTPEQLSLLLAPIEPASRSFGASGSVSASNIPDISQLLQELPAGMVDLLRPISPASLENVQ